MKVLITIPVYNEEKIIKNNLLQLISFLKENLAEHNYKIIVADNKSVDQTAEIVKELALQIGQLDYLYLDQIGKGLAIRKSWQKFSDEFEIFIFMDADLATDLKALPDLIKAIESGNDLAVGSRYLKESEVKRSFARRLFSFGYRLFLKIFLQTKIKDMPCGFKAVSQKVVKEILPKVKNNTWFFDTELLYLAEKAGYKIKEIPVKWAEPRQEKDKSKVNLAKVSWLYLKELWRLKFRP